MREFQRKEENGEEFGKRYRKPRHLVMSRAEEAFKRISEIKQVRAVIRATIKNADTPLAQLLRFQSLRTLSLAPFCKFLQPNLREAFRKSGNLIAIRLKGRNARAL
jgi:hypothetical protein